MTDICRRLEELGQDILAIDRAIDLEGISLSQGCDEQGEFVEIAVTAAGLGTHTHRAYKEE